LSAARAVWLTCSLLIAAAITACASGLPLVWDGAYQLAASLVEQKPYFYQTRFHSWLLWWPVVVLSRATDNLTALTFAFGLPFIAAPAVSLWLSWIVVRRHRPELIIWAAFGVAVAGLPGQAFLINDSIWQQTMFWPVFLGALVPVSRRCACSLGVLALFQLSHQAGILLLAAALVAAVAAGRSQPALRHAQSVKVVALAVLLALAMAKALWVSNPRWSGALYDSYATQRMSWSEISTTWRDGVLGPPLYGMLAMWLAAFAPLARSRRVERLGLVAILGAGVLWAWWAAEPGRWAGAINFRRWVVPVTFPFLLAAFLAARRPRGTLASFAIAPAVAAVFFTVVALQSLGWRRLVARLENDIANDRRAVVPHDAVPWVARTPMDHWGMTALVALHGGTRPEKYFAFNADALAALRAGSIWLGDSHTISPGPGAAGFFDHRPLLERFRQESR
jgi:hypothetical protein